MQKNPADSYRSAAEPRVTFSGSAASRRLAPVAQPAWLVAIAAAAIDAAARSACSRRVRRSSPLGAGGGDPQIAKPVAGDRWARRSRSRSRRRSIAGDRSRARRRGGEPCRLDSRDARRRAVEVKDYSTPRSPGSTGTTPIENKRVLNGFCAGIVGRERRESRRRSDDVRRRELDPRARRAGAEGNVAGPGRTVGQPRVVSGTRRLVLPSFFIDRLEVTNRKYQEFVDEGGYETPRYWKQPSSATGAKSHRKRSDGAVPRLDRRGRARRPGPAVTRRRAKAMIPLRA